MNRTIPIWGKMLLVLSCIILAPVLFLLCAALFISAFVCLTISALNIFHIEISLILDQLAFIEAIPRVYSILGSVLAVALAVISYQGMKAYLAFCGRLISSPKEEMYEYESDTYEEEYDQFSDEYTNTADEKMDEKKDITHVK